MALAVAGSSPVSHPYSFNLLDSLSACSAEIHCKLYSSRCRMIWYMTGKSVHLIMAVFLLSAVSVFGSSAIKEDPDKKTQVICHKGDLEETLFHSPRALNIIGQEFYGAASRFKYILGGSFRDVNDTHDIQAILRF